MKTAFVYLASGVLALVAGIAVAQTDCFTVPPRMEGELISGIANLQQSATKSAARTQLMKALDKPLPKFDVTAMPLDKAIEQWVKVADINVQINWDAIKECGVKTDVGVTAHIKDVPAGRVLQNLLDEAGKGTVGLRYHVSENVLDISTRDDFESVKYQVTRIYDTTFMFVDLEPNGEGAAEIAANLTELIKATIQPESWRDAGGTIGSIRILNGCLIVNQVEESHDQIAHFIDILRRHRRDRTQAYDIKDLLKSASTPATTTAPDDNSAAAAVIKVIQSACGRDTWKGAGGKSSTVAYYNGKLYITASPAVHEQVRSLLALMRKKD